MKIRHISLSTGILLLYSPGNLKTCKTHFSGPIFLIPIFLIPIFLIPSPQTSESEGVCGRGDEDPAGAVVKLQDDDDGVLIDLHIHTETTLL